MVKATTGLVMIAAAAAVAMVLLQSVRYALYSVGALALCVGAVLVVLEPELHEHHHR